MKKIEHQKIAKRIVERKNKEIEAVSQVLSEDVEFWLSETALWSDKAIACQDLLSRILNEVEVSDDLRQQINQALKHPYQE